jgi:V/A-type H+-transporting ATPase subunit I
MGGGAVIVPMKKATILFETGEEDAAVRSLRRLGVMHIEHQNPPAGRDVTALQEKVALIDASLDVFNQVMAQEKQKPRQDTISGDWTAIADHIIEQGKRLEQLESSSRNILGLIHEWERWGDVDLGMVRQLSRHGVYFRLYQVPAGEMHRLPADAVVKTVFTEGDIACCAVVSRRQFACDFKEIIPPEHGLSALKAQLAGNIEAREEVISGIMEYARFHADLSGRKGQLEKEIEFQQVISGAGREGAIRYVTGYIPSDMEDGLVSEARSMKWGIMVTDPTEADDVPTLIRNPGWVNLIRPVLGLLGLTPGYRELDVSSLFLIFFSIFFGILIGDAGYGLVYILITVVLQTKVMPGPEMKTTYSLFYLLGSCAIVWGILTGTFFGQEWLLNAGYTPLLPQLNDPGSMQTLCFFLGALHLSLAHTWRAALKFPSPKALADAGWICVLWSAFFVARTLILGEAFPPWGIWLVGAGVVLVIVFTNPQANIARGIGEGLMTVALSFMNNITDVISYVRLFAVGLAGLAIAETFNSLASGFGQGIAAIVAGAAILVIGHGLNVILGPMSVLVHGVRLNVLEFSGHANVTWSGVAFDPFKE